MSFTFYLATWIPLVIVVGILAIYRNMLASHEDESIHVLDGDAKQVAAQARFSHKLETIERIGKSLTIVVVAYGLTIGALYLYHVWQQGAKLPG
jgi:hypothetical protein